MTRSNLYDTDLVNWAEATAQLLKQKRFAEIDLENLIEEVENIAKKEKREIRSLLRNLLTCFLKWQFNANDFTRTSLIREISSCRYNIQLLLADSPSLQKAFENSLLDCYKKAKKNVARETGLNINIFPETCVYGSEEILSDDFWPD